MSKSKLRLLLNTLYFGSIILLCIFMWLTNIHLFQMYGELYFLDLHFHFSIAIHHFAPKQKNVKKMTINSYKTVLFEYSVYHSTTKNERFLR